MLVPKAAVNEDDRVMLRQHDVGLPRERPGVQPESQAKGVKAFSHPHFGARMAASDPAHVPAATVRRDPICHP